MAFSYEKGPEKEPHEITCPKCEGTGKVKDKDGVIKTCDLCGGKRTILSHR